MFERSGRLINKKFGEYLIPTTLSGMSMMLGAIVDGVIVSKTIGANAMSAVTVAEPLVLIFQALFFLLGMGGATLITISKGQRDSQKANKAFTLGVATLLVLSVLVLVFGLVFLDGFVGLLCNNASLLDLTRDYVRVLLAGAPFMLFVPGMVFFIRADGQPRLSAAVLLVANGVNLVLDLVFILVFRLGIGGAALATVSGYAVGFILVVKYFLSKRRTLRLIPVKKRELKMVGEIAGSGLAGAVNTLLLTAKTLCINRIVMGVGGADAMAVFAVCNFAISFVSMFNSGASDTMVPLLGMLYGEQDWKGVRIVLKRTFTVVIVCCAASILLIELMPVQMLGLFNVTTPARVAMGVPALRIFAFSLLGVGISYTMMYYLQTVRHRVLSVTISLLRGFVLIIPCAWAFSLVFGVEGVWWAYVLAEGLTILLTILLCRITAARSAGRYRGLFLFETPPEAQALYDVTIRGQVQDAVAISSRLIDFGRDSGLASGQANLVGLMAEEATVNIMEFNAGRSPVEVDIRCRIRPQEIVISLRDDGEPFDTMSVTPQEEACFACDSIAVMNRIAQKVEYTRVLGLNNTAILLKREE